MTPGKGQTSHLGRERSQDDCKQRVLSPAERISHASNCQLWEEGQEVGTCAWPPRQEGEVPGC